MTTNPKEYAHAYYLAHKEQYKGYVEKYKEKKKKEKYEAYLASLTPAQRYYAMNKEKVKAQQKAYRERKKKKEYNKTYYMANRDRIRALNRENYFKTRREQRLSKTFIGRIWLKIFW